MYLDDHIQRLNQSAAAFQHQPQGCSPEQMEQIKKNIREFLKRSLSF
jgi:hypothetical protein